MTLKRVILAIATASIATAMMFVFVVVAYLEIRDEGYCPGPNLCTAKALKHQKGSRP